MAGKRGQSGWMHLVDADGFVCEIILPAACGSEATHTKKGKSSPVHQGHKRRVILELEFRFE